MTTEEDDDKTQIARANLERLSLGEELTTSPLNIEGIFDHVPTFDSLLTGQELFNCIMTCTTWNETLKERDDTYKKLLQWKCSGRPTFMIRIEDRDRLIYGGTNYKQMVLRVCKAATRRRIIKLDRQSLSVDRCITHYWSHFDNGRSQEGEEMTVRNFEKHGYKEIARDHRFITFDAEPFWTFVERSMFPDG